MRKLIVEINGIGQLKKIRFHFTQPINLIYAENGTGKTTLSRLFAAVNDRELPPALLSLLSPAAACCFVDQNEAETVLHHQKWQGAVNRFQVFNSDYYRRNLVNLIGSQAYIGGEELNSLRYYLKIWNVLTELNDCQTAEDYWDFITKNESLTKLLHAETVSPFLDWYQTNPFATDAACQQHQQVLQQAAHEIYLFADQNVIDKLNLIAIVNFVNRCAFAFPTSLTKIKAHYYVNLRTGSRLKQQINLQVPEWLFWKLVMVYQLLAEFERAYNLLPAKITNQHPFTANVADQKSYQIFAKGAAKRKNCWWWSKN